MVTVDMRSLLLFSAFLRVFLIVYGEWQDKHMEVRYTDVDYFVFSDAADLMASGKSPYERTTYRYSPLLAFLLLPNTFLHRSWGKFFSRPQRIWKRNRKWFHLLYLDPRDLLVGVFIYTILKKCSVPKNICTYCVMAWLLNPFTFTIGTRGNCEPIVCAIILWIIICLMNGNLLQAAVCYGLVVHFRIYPIIYAPTLVLVLNHHFFCLGQKPVLRIWSSGPSKKHESSTAATELNVLVAIKCIFSRERIIFGVISAAVFFFCTGISFFLYKWEFLHEALLYHLTRTDPRHNFSIYFYHIYLHYEREFSVLEKLISFLPQFMVQLVLVLCFARDLPFCLFVQTVAFVAFNKVITAQYFVWFFCLLPLILPWSTINFKWKGLCCIFLWMGAQSHWLMWGYLLEFKGKNVFVELWMASLVFLAANTCVLAVMISNHTYSPLFLLLKQNSSDPGLKQE